MDAVLKIAIVAAAAWLLIGGKGVLESKRRPPAGPAAADSAAMAAAADTVAAMTAASLSRVGFRLGSRDYLQDLSAYVYHLPEVEVTYHVLPHSDRCAVDSLPACLQQEVRANQIDPREFQYTYFCDRVSLAGAGILRWQNREYMVTADSLAAGGWNGGKQKAANSYDCAAFSYKSKTSLEFIPERLKAKSVFVPIAKASFPNGPTVSGQQAIDWLTLAVNPAELPLSVPDLAMRRLLSQNKSGTKRKAPFARVYVVLEFPGGYKLLTEAADVNENLKVKQVSLRIADSGNDVVAFQTLGSRATATAYLVADENMTYDRILAGSGK